MDNFATVKHKMKIGSLKKKYDLIITTRSERDGIPHHDLLILHPKQTMLSIKSQIISALDNRRERGKVTVGIDPGLNTGVALLYNQQPIVTNVLYSINHIVIWIKNQLQKLVYEGVLFKIGDGGGDRQIEIITAIERNFDAPIYIVDEYNTSKRLDNRITRHEIAAILIAERDGERV